MNDTGIMEEEIMNIHEEEYILKLVKRKRQHIVDNSSK